MEICKAPTMRLKVLNTHSVHREGNVINNKNVLKKEKKTKTKTKN